MAVRRRHPPRPVATGTCLGAVAMVTAIAVGCAIVPAAAPPIATAAGAAKPMPRTVAIETLFVRIAPDETDAEEALWQAADEQAIDAGLRRRLAAHGLRAGVVSSLLPAEMRTKLEASGPRVVETAPTPASEQVVARRVLRLLPGKEGRLVARTSVAELVVFESVSDGAGGDSVLGRTFRDATSELVLCAWPAADGRSRISIVPAIEHGPQRRSWTGENGIFQLEAGQARHFFESLQIDLELAPDRMLVVGGHGGVESSVASALFRESSAGDRRVVILRPLDRALDPMFDERGGDDGQPPERPGRAAEGLPAGVSETAR